MINYHVLHHKSHYSCGLATGTASEVVLACKAKNIHSIAITDVNTMSGVIDFRQVAKKENLNIILGCQLSIFLTDELKSIDIVLLIENQVGYSNLCRLITLANENNQRSSFRMVSMEIFRNHTEGLICLSRDISYDKNLSALFGDNLFYEIIGSVSEVDVNLQILQNIMPHRIVVSPDSSIVYEKDKELQDIMITNTKFVKEAIILPNPKPIKNQQELLIEFVTNHTYISQDILMESFKNTGVVGDRCINVELTFSDQLVDYPHLLHPLNLDGCSKIELTKRIIKKNNKFNMDDPIYSARLDYELQAICHNKRINLIDYFLVLEDTIRWCGENGITVGPGRGSGAGSLVNYGLGITKLDPIRFKLLFERFISEGRIEAGTLPDIDLDFSHPNKVKDYWIEMYGDDRVVPIGTMQTLQAKGALKDVFHARHPEVPYELVNRITKSFPDPTQEETQLEYFERSLKESEFADESLHEYPYAVETLKKLLGQNRQPSIHPCFSGDSTILTIDGYKTFEYCSDTVQTILTPDGWEEAKIFKQPIKRELFEHRLSMSKKSRTSIVSKNTIEHLFLCDDRYLPLAEGEELSLKNHGDFDKDLVFLGWAWNDGFYCKTHKTIMYYITPDKDFEFLNYLGVPELKAKHNLGKERTQELMSMYGYDTRRVYDKQLPLGIARWTMYEKSSFLRGMFSANGTSLRKEIRIKLTSKSLIIEIKELLLSFGIDCPDYVVNVGKKVKFPNGDYLCRDSYCLTINSTGSTKFLSLIGFVQTYKNDNILNSIKFSCIKKVKSLGIHEVYDFTVKDGTPAGYVNGFWAHNCGLAITEDKISDIAPMRYNNNRWSLEYNGNDCETVGIIKYDALGLKTLKFIQGACDLVGILDPWDIPIDDKKTFTAFMDGKTTAVFQFNSQVAINILSQIPVHSLDDLTMTTSVGRPGTMANKVHLDFIKLKNGYKKPIAPHEMLAEELAETYGVMIYQENVMKAAQILGGFSMAEADDVRKAMGKKKPELLVKPKARFIKHAISQRYCNEEKAEEIWQLMATFAGYGFNKSHAISYAFIGYVCMYLKVHHPLEWWTSCFTNEDKPDRIREYYREARDSINLPDVNRSEDKYLIRDGKMQMPVTGIKFVGQKACDDIVEKRPFKNFDDFFKRVNKTSVNVRVMKNLIVSGAFNDIEDRKYGELINRLYELQGTKKPKEFDNFNYQKLMEMREKILDFISVNYYDVYFDEFIDENLYNISTINSLEDNVSVSIGGKLVELKQRKTRKGEVFGALRIENDNAVVSVTIWPQQYKGLKKKLVVGEIYKIHGKTNQYEKKVQVVCNKIYTLEECRNREDLK